MPDLILAWKVSPQNTQQSILTSNTDTQGAVLVTITNDGVNPVAITFDGYYTYDKLDAGMSTGYVQNFISVIAYKHDGSLAATPQDSDALETHGVFTLTPLPARPSPNPRDV